jgi:LPXTG-motif cell wall-anchored protein
VDGIPGILPIVCNADEIVGAAGVREALDVFVLSVGSNSLAKETTAAAESLSVAPAGETGPQCSDKIDNDGDGKIDGNDPGCHNDNNPKNPSSYNPQDNDETDKKGGGKGNDGSGVKGEQGGGKGGEGGEGNEGSGGKGGAGGPECSDTIDNDGDGLVDAKDSGCHSDGNANNPKSYNANDNSEGEGAGNLNAGALPFTGTDVIGIGLAGLLVLAGGLLMRRREDARSVR